MGKKAAEDSEGVKIVAENRKAHFDYVFLDKYEAGIALTGAEIKSVRNGGVSLTESYVRPGQNEMWILQLHIKPYTFNADRTYDPIRKRKLLLHRKEINQLRGGVERKGLTIVPLRMYLKNGYAKVQIALAKGKSAPDKRETIKRREADREAKRAMKQRT